MKVIADTNVLLRLVVGDDKAQARAAARLLEGAQTVAVGVRTLCELAWVLDRSYAVAREDIAATIRQLIDTARVAVDRPAVMAGLAILEAGGDFADGVIAYEGRWLGGETFVSFDRKAVRLLAAQGHRSQLLVTRGRP
ncbi:MAG: type II toxin-antitoxin system VapC family toxin [Proteobacteria bacterium]|nr:type II toxin-antitoxin system VapC family toxin [Pseudomonadota bacterium]